MWLPSSGGGGGGGAYGPVTTTDNAVVRWNGADGDNIQDSGVLIDDSNNVTLPDAAKIGYSDLVLSRLAGPFLALMNAVGDSYRSLKGRAFEAHNGTDMRAVIDPADRVGLALASGGGVHWDSSATPYGGSEDTSITRTAAGVVKVTSSMLIPEASAPTAVANAVILFAQDNGAGKTQLMALFPTGAAKQIDIEL